jgi:hypothetical protein
MRCPTRPEFISRGFFLAAIAMGEARARDPRNRAWHG